MNDNETLVNESLNRLKNVNNSDDYILTLNQILKQINFFDIGKIVWILHNINLNCTFLGKEYQKYYSHFEDVLTKKREERKMNNNKNKPIVDIQAEYEEMRTYELNKLRDRLRIQEELLQTQTKIISDLINNREIIKEKDLKIRELTDENERNLKNFEEKYLSLQNKYEEKIREYKDSVQRMEEEIEINYFKLEELNELVDEKERIIFRQKDTIHSQGKEIEVYQEKISKIKRCLKDFD